MLGVEEFGQTISKNRVIFNQEDLAFLLYQLAHFEKYTPNLLAHKAIECENHVTENISAEVVVGLKRVEIGALSIDSGFFKCPYNDIACLKVVLKG